jgi:AcrR family transcriptional regulator
VPSAAKPPVASTSKRPRGPYAKTEEQRRRILLGALEFFGEYGYWGSSMRDIAAHIGMSQAGLAHHFPTKVELLEAVLEERDRQSAAAIDDLGGRTRLGAITAIVERNVSQPGVVRLFSRLAAEATSEEHPAHTFFQQRNERVAKQLADLLTQAKRAGEVPPHINPRKAARHCQAMMFGLQVQWLIDPEIDMAALFTSFMATYFRS